ncbi:MerR family transcriptional regulator [Paenibacillus senegalensis]|uniref:MerR family transcriptional regulator n=1 Tax=Paenibacillus senegalensis TaxID=1465766 RepID=UPI00028A05D2|nr:MerR family transcriptional regulator [Paenibacillus senegalensis]
MYTIGQLSKKTGVTVRTLDYYDEIDLLKPASATEGGHRLYGNEEIMRLEQILALKFLGFSLEKIQLILQEAPPSWETAFTEQLLMVEEEKKRLEDLQRSLQGILYSIQIEKKVNWQLIFGVMQMFQQGENEAVRVLDRYMSREQQKKMLSVNMDQDKMDHWVALIYEIRENLHASPDSDIAQHLAERWMEGVYEMFGNDDEFLGNAWNAITKESDGVMFYPMTKDVVDFITKAIQIKESKGTGLGKEGG